MEAAWTNETFAFFYKITWPHNPEELESLPLWKPQTSFLFPQYYWTGKNNPERLHILVDCSNVSANFIILNAI